MKKILSLLIVLFVLIVSISMFNQKIPIYNEFEGGIINNFSIGYSDIPEDNGL